MVTSEQAVAVADKARKMPRESAFGCSRDFLNNRFVYVVVSPRAHGLSIGINMNPDKLCNFDCIYCEVDRCAPGAEKKLDAKVMTGELQRTLAFVHSEQTRHAPRYQGLPEDLLQLRNVALSGDGEPTLCPNF